MIMYLRRQYEYTFKHRRQHTMQQFMHKKCDRIVFNLDSICLKHYTVGLCVMGWTPHIIRTSFFCSICSLCKWISAAVPQTWIPYDIWGKINALYKLSNVSDSNDLHTFITITVPFVIFRDIHITCSIQFNLLSIINPTNFALSTSWILKLNMDGRIFFVVILGSKYKICLVNIKI